MTQLGRYGAFAICIALLALASGVAGHFPLIWAAVWLLGSLCLLGVCGTSCRRGTRCCATIR